MDRQLTLKVRLKDEATFANFYAADNQPAITYVKNFLSDDNLGELIYLWGLPGAGRTHLLHACCYAAIARQKTAIFLPLAEHAVLSPQIFEGLEAFSLLCLDDVQAIAGNRDWEEALFHLYNRTFNKKTRWIIAADAPPRQINFVLPDLQSRLTQAVIFNIKTLSDEEKAAALRWRAQLRGLLLTEEVSQFLLTRYSRDMNALFTALDKLDQASLAVQKKLTVPFVKAVLAV